MIRGRKDIRRLIRDRERKKVVARKESGFRNTSLTTRKILESWEDIETEGYTEETDDVESDLREVSPVTREYFKDWDDFEIEGNPELKDTIRENIIRAEKVNEGEYEKAAHRFGISVDELKERLQVGVETMMYSSDPFIAVHPDILEAVIRDGRWKSQFETGTSDGVVNYESRSDTELRNFSFNKHKLDGSETRNIYDYNCYKSLSTGVLRTDCEKRPIYGYCSDEGNGAVNEQGSIPPPNTIRSYGSVTVKIKKERARQKATFTSDDSLGILRSHKPPSPAAKPHFATLDAQNLNKVDDLSDLDTLKSSVTHQWNGSYIELQYHGGLTLDDVESIHLSPHNTWSPDEKTYEQITKVKEIVSEYNRQCSGSEITIVEF